MASVNGSNDLHVRVVSRRLVKASDDDSIKPHVLAVSNLDLIPQTIQTSMFCIYPRPPTGDFNAVVAAFEAGLPSFLNHFFPLAGRIATNPSSGLPEFHCHNQGAELVVGEAGVPLASLDFGTMTASVRRVQQPYCEDMALSVQLVSFACGGFAVAWCTNHVLVDGSALSMLVSAWSELARSGTLCASSRPNHDRSVFRPRATPSYSASFNEAFMPLHAERQVNVLTAEQSFVERLYYIEASDVARLREAASRDGSERATRFQAVSAYLWKALAGVVGTADAHCRMQWWVDGRRRLTDEPELRAAMRNYIGNVTTFAIREASVDEVQRMALPDVAAMVGEAIAAPSYGQHFQELVDWVEERRADRYVETASLGLGSPTVGVTAFTSFPLDTDFGFGHAAMAMPTTSPTARLCSGFVQIAARPDGDGSWISSAFLWPRLAAALESDEPCVFKPVTAEYLGLRAP
ncbi:hypothetical protein SETIT_5G054300v2 [Setaria italica]|uniref:Omega-hydroxypalmitate O-feruloyl transferase n=1 Tax=Setaria italica TaxID=4555 RepID=A0A368R1V8_SETIT|nr:putrescine hydroxycinnamoyltransferase 3 [Setaria italica]RCV24054.1 hypothetical protein SETIT_5G054300v2 [Setaria italica]